jgi:hypothetical protein
MVELILDEVVKHGMDPERMTRYYNSRRIELRFTETPPPVDPTVRTCLACGETKPLDGVAWRRKTRPNGLGAKWPGRCAACVDARRPSASQVAYEQARPSRRTSRKTGQDGA